jgi:NAD(P)-dependent dehydrogenase (short-subunit alcohol dehydrogenase family)
MRNWFITGVSTGLGRALAERALEAGDLVIGTLRDAKARTEFEQIAPGHSVGVILDVTDEAAVSRVTREVLAHYGSIDILVNNAGYGLEGAIEETSSAQTRRLFDVNVFGLLSVTQAVLPSMRARRSGHIFNVASIGGLTTFPGVGIYNGTKFAVEGISEALAKEVSPLGIKVTIIEPGAFRTDWAGRSMDHIETPIPDYDATAGEFRRGLVKRNGKQPGDPKKAASIVFNVAGAADAPLHLLLGRDALAAAGVKLGALQTELMKWAPVSASTDFE